MYNVKVYQRNTESAVSVSKNFKASEYACHDGSNAIFIADELAILVQKIRDAAKAPVTINSGYRTPSHNKANGGAENSMHLFGCAADLSCPKLPMSDFRIIVNSVMGNKGGVGYYKSFIHVDCRSTPSRWNG